MYPNEYWGIELSTKRPFFTSTNGDTFPAELENTTHEHAATIDISYYHSAATGQALVSPHHQIDKQRYGDQAIEWGLVYAEFRLTKIGFEEYNEYQDAGHYKHLFEHALPIQDPLHAPNSIADEQNHALEVGHVLAFRGYGDRFGLLRVEAIADDGIKFDLKVQPAKAE
jgi:hypothetical protein